MLTVIMCRSVQQFMSLKSSDNSMGKHTDIASDRRDIKSRYIAIMPVDANETGHIFIFTIKVGYKIDLSVS